MVRIVERRGGLSSTPGDQPGRPCKQGFESDAATHFISAVADMATFHSGIPGRVTVAWEQPSEPHHYEGI